MPSDSLAFGSQDYHDFGSRQASVGQRMTSSVDPFMTNGTLHRMPPSSSSPISGTLPRSTAALRTELRGLQENLVQLKAVIAARRPNRPGSRVGAKTVTDIHTASPAVSLDGGGWQGDDECGVSQPDSAALSNTLQTHILQSLHTLTQRLHKLERKNEEIDSTSSPARVMDQIQSDDKMSQHLSEAGASALATELARERFQRLKLEALVRSLGPRIGLDTKYLMFGPLHSRSSQLISEQEFQPSLLQSMDEEELRSVVRHLSVRTKEALRAQAISRGKSVEAQTALRSIADLSARVAALEEERTRTPIPHHAMTIANMSVKIRSQSLKIRQLQDELGEINANLRPAYFELKGPFDVNQIYKSIRSLKRVKSASPTKVTSPRSSTKNRDPDTTPSENDPREYEPDPTDPIDIQVARVVDSRSSKKVPLKRLSPGLYEYGQQQIRVTLSSTSQTPLAFWNGRKFSLKRFLALFEESEWAQFQRPNRMGKFLHEANSFSEPMRELTTTAPAESARWQMETPQAASRGGESDSPPKPASRMTPAPVLLPSTTPNVLLNQGITRDHPIMGVGPQQRRISGTTHSFPSRMIHASQAPNPIPTRAVQREVVEWLNRNTPSPPAWTQPAGLRQAGVNRPAANALTRASPPRLEGWLGNSGPLSSDLVNPMLYK